MQGISLSLIAWGRYHGDWGGQMLVLFIIAIAACEAAIAMALILMLSLLIVVAWTWLSGRTCEQGQPAHVDREVPEERLKPQVWPKLTPAGVEPEVDEEKQLYRSRV